MGHATKHCQLCSRRKDGVWLHLDVWVTVLLHAWRVLSLVYPALFPQSYTSRHHQRPPCSTSWCTRCSPSLSSPWPSSWPSGCIVTASLPTGTSTLMRWGGNDELFQVALLYLDLTKGREAAQCMFTSALASLFSGGLTCLIYLFEVGGTVGLCGSVSIPCEADGFGLVYCHGQDS